MASWIADSAAERSRGERKTKRLVTGSRLARVRSIRDELLNGRLAREFDEETFAHKDTELRDEEARLKDQIDAIDDHRTDETSLVVETLNCPNTCATRKPFDVLARGLVTAGSESGDPEGI